MFKLLKVLFGYRETIVVEKNLDVNKTYRKFYSIHWRNVWYNFLQILKNWPRKGNYRKHYSFNNKIPNKVLGYVSIASVKNAVQSSSDNKSGLINAYKHGEIIVNSNFTLKK